MVADKDNKKTHMSVNLILEEHALLKDLAKFERRPITDEIMLLVARERKLLGMPEALEVDKLATSE